MATTKKRIMLCLTKGMETQLAQLEDNFGENPAQVMGRALILLHYLTFTDISSFKSEKA